MTALPLPLALNCYKVRLALAQLGIAHELVEMDILQGETRTPEFIAKNPNGHVPLLEVAPFAVKDEFWATTFWMFAGEALFGLAFLCISHYRRQFFQLFRSNPLAMVAINGSNELINLGGGLSNRYALLFAPLSVVQAIGSTTTLFVFAIGVALTMVLPGWSKEDLSPRELIVKGMAALLVAAGVTLVSR